MTSLANQRPTPSAVRKPARPGPFGYLSVSTSCQHTHTRRWRSEHARRNRPAHSAHHHQGAVKYPCGRLQAGLMELIKMCSINRTAGPLPFHRPPTPALPPRVRLPIAIAPLSLPRCPDPPRASSLSLSLSPSLCDPRTSRAQSNICV